MQREKIKTIICWILVAVCMSIIFWLSSRTSAESSAQSGAILKWLTDILGNNNFTDFIVRKSAHCLEFAGLCFLFNLAFWQTNKTPMPIWSVIFTSLYAATDEIHQKFVAGRSCELRDWAIDSGGAILGTICFIIILTIIRHISKRKNSIDRNNN